MIPGSDGPVALMTMQRIVAGPTTSGRSSGARLTDLGKTWTDPAPIPGLGRHDTDTLGLAEGVCDVSPDYHASTNTTLAMGHNVDYCAGHLARPQGPRWPVYTVRDAQGNWSQPQRLRWDDSRGSEIYTSGCGQRIMLESGDVLVPLSFGNADWPARAFSSALCSFRREDAGRQASGKRVDQQRQTGTA